jgi:hypothetical protein
VESTQANSTTSRSTGTRIGALVAIAGILALGALIVHELRPHRAATHGASSVPDDRTAEAPPVVAPSPSSIANGSARPVPVAKPNAPSAHAAPPAAGPAIPTAATVISQVVADPDAFAPSHVFSPPAGPEQLYNFEPLPPFNSTTLKRSRKDPSAWELDAMHGPKMSDLGPAGAVHQAVIVKDSIGNETPWYSIDSGPLAPAYAVMQAGSIRVMSRAFMLANRGDLPPGVATTLDR